MVYKRVVEFAQIHVNNIILLLNDNKFDILLFRMEFFKIENFSKYINGIMKKNNT
jgi:hypothetical protein